MNQETIFKIIASVLVLVSLFTIGYVINAFLFPPEVVVAQDPFTLNFSNYTR